MLELWYADQLAHLNTFYSLAFTSLDQLHEINLNVIDLGHHVVQEDEEAFLASIARCF